MKALLWGFIAFLIAWLMVACTQRIYVPMAAATHDTAYHSTHRTDSVYVHDLILLWAHTEGDTVYRDKVVTRYEYRYKVRQDTVLAVRSDTVSIPIATVRELGWWERTRIRMFVPLVVLCVLLCVSVWWMVRNR